MATLEQKRERMRRIFRGLETYGEGTAAEQARQYRLAEIYQDAVAAARANSAGIERPQVDLLVSLSGYSPETTLLAYELILPSQLLVISSEKTIDQIDVIHEKIGGRLRMSQMTHLKVDPVNPVDIYELVKRAVRPARPGDPPISAIIDITGGKKVMSASAALAASQLDLKLCYIDSEFDTEMRQAIPGTERLCILANPTVLFGDRDMEAAWQMFTSGNYLGAAQRFGELCGRVSEPARARYMRDLATLYQSWCDLNGEAMPRDVEQLRARLGDPRSEIRPETARRLAEQLDFVQRLCAKESSALLLNSYLLGEHYYQLGRYDFAALLYYRTIEKCAAERLRQGYGGFDVSEPQYRLLDPDPDALASRFGQLAMKVYKSEYPISLPFQMGLMDTAIMLHLLGDQMLRAAGIRDIDALRHLRALAKIRNRSVLAHGDLVVGKDDCKVFRPKALAHLRAFWRLHEADQDIDQRIETLGFISEA